MFRIYLIDSTDDSGKSLDSVQTSRDVEQPEGDVLLSNSEENLDELEEQEQCPDTMPSSGSSISTAKSFSNEHKAEEPASKNLDSQLGNSQVLFDQFKVAVSRLMLVQISMCPKRTRISVSISIRLATTKLKQQI